MEEGENKKEKPLYWLKMTCSAVRSIEESGKLDSLHLIFKKNKRKMTGSNKKSAPSKSET